MKRAFAIAASATFLGGCFLEKDDRTIVVDGEGVVMATPDTFNIQATLHSNAGEQSETLKLISQSMDTIAANLPALAGLEAVEIDSASVAVAPLYERLCVKDTEYGQRDTCPINGYESDVVLNISGSPASIAGNAVSYLAELGASGVRIQGYSISTMQEKRSDATVAAINDARSKAKRLADGMNVTLGDPQRIQYGAGMRDNFDYDRDSGMYAFAVASPSPAGDRVSPEVKLAISVQPIEIREKITAAFAIKSPKP